MDTWNRDRSVTGKTFQTSRYSHSEIIPYSGARRMENSSYFNSRPPAQVAAPTSKSTSAWSLADPDVKRQRRVVSYKIYTAEGKLRSSLNRSFRWVKNKYIELRYGLV